MYVIFILQVRAVQYLHLGNVAFVSPSAVLSATTPPEVVKKPCLIFDLFSYSVLAVHPVEIETSKIFSKLYRGTWHQSWEIWVSKNNFGSISCRRQLSPPKLLDVLVSESGGKFYFICTTTFKNFNGSGKGSKSFLLSAINTRTSFVSISASHVHDDSFRFINLSTTRFDWSFWKCISLRMEISNSLLHVSFSLVCIISGLGRHTTVQKKVNFCTFSNRKLGLRNGPGWETMQH